MAVSTRSMTAPSRAPVRLAWVLHAGVLRPVTDFAHLRPRARPPVACPVCGEPVTLRFGAGRAARAAHQPDSTCPVRSPETALHLNTKHHLAAALRVAVPHGRLVVRHRCAHRSGVLGETIMVPGAVPCERLHEYPLVADWDAVDVERGLSATRPDILLLRGGRPLGLLEVRHTSALTAEKLERFAALGLPWAEVVASRALYAEFTAWSAARPLTVLRTSASAPWRCEDHRHAQRARGQASSSVGPWMARVVDRYLPTGRVVREVVYVEGRRRGARLHDVALRDRSGTLLAALPDGTADQVLARAHAAFRRWALVHRRAGELVDSPMSWSPPAGMFSEEVGWTAGTTFFPRRLQRVGGAWTPRPGVGTLRWESPGGTARRSGRVATSSAEPPMPPGPPEPPEPPTGCVRHDAP